MSYDSRIISVSVKVKDNGEGSLLFDASYAGDKIFKNIYTEPVYNITVTSEGGGTASALPASGTRGTGITLSALPAEGFRFREWQVVSGGVSIEGDGFTVGTEDVVIRAVFEAIEYNITVTSEGGDAGGAVGSTVSGAINTVVAYLCDCCLGWVFYRKEKGSVRATCEGAVLFFKHGKALARNLGRIFGMGLLSLLVIGGAAGLIAYLIFGRFPAVFVTLAAEFARNPGSGDNRMIYEILSKPSTLMIAAAVATGVAIWSVIHSAFVRPFILTGVLRNYMEAGMQDVPSEASFETLKSKSPKFAKLCEKLD